MYELNIVNKDNKQGCNVFTQYVFFRKKTPKITLLIYLRGEFILNQSIITMLLLFLPIPFFEQLPRVYLLLLRF